MKRILLITIMLFLTIMLSGCDCQHEWTEANCQTPQICGKCQEIGAEALGHDWFDANCTAPKHCSRCSETQGDPLGHSFEDWTFGETDMTHSCALCGLEETTDLDHGLYLETLLSGFWEGSILFHGEDVYSAYDFSTPLDALCFEEGRSVRGHINGEDVTGSWEFLEYKEEDGQQDYIFGVDTGKEFKWTMLLSVQEDENLLYILYPNGDQMLLSDNAALADSIVSVGSWGGEGTGGMYSLTFHADRTVTGTLDQEFEGTWQLIYQEEVGGLEDYLVDTRYCGVYIRYQQNGEDILLQATIRPSDENMFQTRTEAFTPGQLKLSYNNSSFILEPMTQQQIAEQNRAMTEGPNQLLGTWSSLYWRNLSNGSNTSLTGYSITFHSDNTFTANLDKERTGIWSYQNDRSNASDPQSGSYCYYLQFDNDRHLYCAILYYRDNSMPELQLQGDSKSLYLGRLSEKDHQVLGKVIGQWVSTQENINHFSTEESTFVYTTDYHFTFHEDGTFEGFDGTKLRGNWYLSQIYYNEDNSGSYYFDIITDDPDNPYTLIIYDHVDEILVEFRETRSKYQRFVSLEQLSQEDLDAIALAPTIPIGDWISSYVHYYADEDSAEKEIETSSYSFQVNENGTFTAQLDTTIQGTWGFMKYYPDSSYSFWMDYPGMPETGQNYFSVGLEGDFLTFRLTADGQRAFYYMVRK